MQREVRGDYTPSFSFFTMAGYKNKNMGSSSFNFKSESFANNQTKNLEMCKAYSILIEGLNEG